MKLGQGQPYLAARQEIYGLAIETKKERIARPESRIKRGSHESGAVQSDIWSPARKEGQDKRNSKPLSSPLIVI